MLYVICLFVGFYVIKRDFENIVCNFVIHKTICYESKNNYQFSIHLFGVHLSNVFYEFK